MSVKTMFWALTLFLAGCAVGPDFQSPKPPQTSRYTQEPLPETTVSVPVPFGQAQQLVSGLAAEAQWWKAFGSPRLNQLIDRALRASLTLESMRAKEREALERQSAWAGAHTMPQAQANAANQRQRQNPAQQGLEASPREFTLYDASVSLHYTLDVAGGQRRALESLSAKAEARRFETQAAQLSLAGNLVQAAIGRAQLAENLVLAQQQLDSLNKQMDIARARVAVGQASVDLVHILSGQQAEAQESLILLRQQLTRQDNQLAVLSGQAPGAADIPDFRLDEFTLPTRVPQVLPSMLVRARPDIRASEAMLHAATADYGVAVSQLYPQIELSASLGSQALSSGALFGAGSAAWTLLAGLTQPLFKPGLAAEKRAALAAMDAASAQYQTVVLEAFKEVANALQTLDADARLLEAQAQADLAAQARWRTAQRQYDLGALAYVDVLDFERNAQMVRAALVEQQGQRLANTAKLFVAMGVAPQFDS
ncbi:efflux transporter outer membrane subunit [Castellaniella sp.]|uniref:efflux transporter outer membrane subunit n=1 Tax=Castellaniella sp. TaxID=1955812 RepID=UPI003A949767